MKKIRVKKFTTLFLLVLLSFSMVAGLFKIPLISILEVHATGGITRVQGNAKGTSTGSSFCSDTLSNTPASGDLLLFSNSSLIGNLETIVNSVNYTNDIDAVYQGMIVGETSMQQLVTAYLALTNPTTILQWTPILSKLGYVNQTTIEWALDNQQMMSDGLPYTYLDSANSQEAFLVYDRYMILAYGYAIQYNYDLNKWNLTQAYNSFTSAVTASAYPALLWIDQDGVPFTISYGPRYYDECGETIDCFLDFYSLGITTALNDSLTTWLWANNNLWSGTNYNYARTWSGYECEAGGFLQVALLLWHEDSSLVDVNNTFADIENRFLQEQWLSPQWTPTLGGASSYVVVHMASGNSQLRLENTVMAWAAILGSYGELNSTYQSDVQSMLTGTTPAWLELLQSPLDSNFPYFSENSASGASNDATATGADLLFMLGIVPQTAALAVPIEENSYEYIYNILDPGLFNINLTTNAVTVSLATAGTLNFQFNQTVTDSFSTSGIYTVQFSSDWNTILKITFVSTQPSNRQYMYTTPLSYYITSSADSNSIISPSGNVMVNANFSQTFTYSANSGYTIASVLVDGSSVPITGSYTFNNVQANHTISVTSTVNPTITASAGAGGSISPSESISVNYGDSQSFTITASAGYHIADVVVDGVSQGAVSSYTFTNVQAAHTIAASFAINTYLITVTQGANGQIAPETTTINYGGSQTFTITPNTGYYIASLTVDGSAVSVASSYTFSNVQAAHTITATFAPTPTPISTPTGTSNPTPTPSASPTSTPTPAPTPTPDSTPLPSQSPTTVPNQTQTQSLPQGAIYGIVATVAIVVIVAVALVFRKQERQKLKETPTKKKTSQTQYSIAIVDLLIERGIITGE